MISHVISGPAVSWKAPGEGPFASARGSEEPRAGKRQKLLPSISLPHPWLAPAAGPSRSPIRTLAETPRQACSPATRKPNGDKRI